MIWKSTEDIIMQDRKLERKGGNEHDNATLIRIFTKHEYNTPCW